MWESKLALHFAVVYLYYRSNSSKVVAGNDGQNRLWFCHGRSHNNIMVTFTTLVKIEYFCNAKTKVETYPMIIITPCACARG